MLASNRSVRNVLWNLTGGLVAGVLIVGATPQYVRRLGMEGYGIVGLWLMMQVLMGLLDIGMGATLVREFANSGLEHTLETKRDLLRTMEVIYMSLSLTLVLGLAGAAGFIASHWLTFQAHTVAYITLTIRLMALTLAFQFSTVLYSNGIAGLQEHGWMNTLQILGNCLRYGSGVAILMVLPDLRWFFAVQALVAGLQLLATRIILWRLIQEPGAGRPVFRIDIFKRLWRFSMGMAATAVAAVFVANSDRIVISKMLPTAELGRYALAYTATGLLQMGIQPFYRAFYPRYAELVSIGDSNFLRDEYFRSCGLMSAVIIPLGVVGWIYAPELFQVWLGRIDPTVVQVFRWLLIAITCSGIMWLPAAFQQAQGRPGLHAAMIASAVVLGIPVMVWAIRAYGLVGATAVWLLHGLSGVTIELWIMHRLMLSGDLFRWYWKVMVGPLVITVPVIYASRWLMPGSFGRAGVLGWVLVAGLLAVAGVIFWFSIVIKKTEWAGRTV